MLDFTITLEHKSHEEEEEEEEVGYHVIHNNNRKHGGRDEEDVKVALTVCVVLIFFIRNIFHFHTQKARFCRTFLTVQSCHEDYRCDLVRFNVSDHQTHDIKSNTK